MESKVRAYAKAKGIKINEIAELDVGETDGLATLKTDEGCIDLRIDKKDGKVFISILPKSTLVRQVLDPLTGELTITSLPDYIAGSEEDDDWGWENTIHRMEV